MRLKKVRTIGEHEFDIIIQAFESILQNNDC